MLFKTAVLQTDTLLHPAVLYIHSRPHPNSKKPIISFFQSGKRNKEIRDCSENIWSFSLRGPDDRPTKALGYHCISKLVDMHHHSVCLLVQ
ncbi:hypothetical protein ILYODFUR_019232, partial [Ilyodon furcidens]